MIKYMVTNGWNDGTEKDEWIFATEAEASEFYEKIDLARDYRTEWMCLPTGGRERHKARRAEKEMFPVDMVGDEVSDYGDAIEYDSYGFEEFYAES